MKKIFFPILLTIAALAGTACDDFLTEHPTTQFSPEAIYQSPDGVQAVLNSCYGYVSQSNGYGGYLHMLLSWHTPTMQLQNRASDYMVGLATMNVATDNSTAQYVYTGAYQTINTVNDLLTNINLCPMSQSERSRIEGEARLLRALSYFNLARIFGAVPYVDRPATSIDESHRPRTDIGKIYALILSDLSDAFELLPEKGKHAYGRPHKWAAKALSAKVNVALACIKEHPGEPFDADLFDKSAAEYWQAAYDDAKAVYDEHVYSLLSNYGDLWVYTN
ncbi:MAG: RagB/SusD family nutrient uptake outer membrane protein, partial [Alistipes sp.]|nr:RagB/SusD family nutrient uptake outer membrane protein [Alistipes sp.]